MDLKCWLVKLCSTAKSYKQQIYRLILLIDSFAIIILFSNIYLIN